MNCLAAASLVRSSCREGVRVGDDLAASAWLDAGFQHCAAAVAANGSLIVSLLVAGLTGSVGHCVGMCGPFVLGQVGARLAAAPAAGMSELRRLSGALLLPYHAGRLTTYAALGAAGALIAGRLSALWPLRWLSAVLLFAAAVLLLLQALRLAGLLTFTPPRPHGSWARIIGRVARLFSERPIGWRGYALGVVLGFLPCGLLYAAVAIASATTEPVAAAAGMLAFWAGTVPSLIVVGWIGHFGLRGLRGAMARLTPAIMALNSVALIGLGLRWVA